MESLRVTREEVEHFLSIKTINSHCYDLGSIYCFTKGSGYGNGYGVGGGSEYGGGSNYDDENGYCDGKGSGSGNGSGLGSGDIDGGSYGYGGGMNVMDIKIFNGCIVDRIDSIPTIITHIHNNVASGFIIRFDMTLIPCYVAKAGNYFAHGKTLKDAVKDAEAKEVREMPIEERIEKFIEVFGSLDSEHIGKEFYDWHHILTGSCRMGRDKFCKENGIDLTKKYSVRYFLNITKNSYGGDVIKEIIKELTKVEYGTI